MISATYSTGEPCSISGRRSDSITPQPATKNFVFATLIDNPKEEAMLAKASNADCAACQDDAIRTESSANWQSVRWKGESERRLRNISLPSNL